MGTPITTTYRDIEITLFETENRWRFTVNGRERSAESVVKAREAIDRALDEVSSKKQKPWKPFEAYFGSTYSSDADFEKVIVTSVAENRSYRGGKQFWINKNGNRRKEDGERLFKACAANDALIAELKEMDKQREAIDKRMQATKKKLVKIQIPSE